MVVNQSNDRGIDWQNIRDLNDVRNLPKHLLYNDTTAYRATDLLILNPNLDEEERKDAIFWKNLLNNLTGLMLVTGEPRSGKGIFMHMLAKKLNYYSSKLVITDTRPTEIFGFHIPFEFKMLIEQLDRMDEVEKGIPRPFIIKGLVKADFDDDEDYKSYRELSDEDKYKEVMARGLVNEDVTFKEYDSRRNQFITIPKCIPHVDEEGRWISSRGEVFLRNSVILLDEFGSKYMPRSKWNLSESQILLNMFNFWGHLHCLMLGVGITLEDFNPRSFDKASWEARCVAIDSSRTVVFDSKPDDIMVAVDIAPIKYNPMARELQSSLRDRQRIYVNGSDPRKFLNGFAIKDSYITDNAQSMYIPQSMRTRRME